MIKPMLPLLLAKGGLMMWLLLLASAVGIGVFIERFLHYHRAQINSAEFLSGVRNVFKRGNVVEALSICEATPGPVARLVKTAILNRERSSDDLRDVLAESGRIEVPRLEEKLSVLATIAQIAPLMGFLGTVLGFIKIFYRLQQAGLYAHMGQLSEGIWEGLISTALGLAIAIPCYAGFNYLVSRVNEIVLDMEKTSTEVIHLICEGRDQP